MVNRRVVVATVTLLALSACSSRPREFEPTLRSVPTDQAKYDTDYQACRTLVAQGHRSGFGARLASGGVGLAAGVGVTAAALGGASGPAGMAVAAGAGSVAVTVLPVVGIAAAWGMAKAAKSRKEREIKKAMGLCLSEAGYSVDTWQVAKRKPRPATTASTKK